MRLYFGENVDIYSYCIIQSYLTSLIITQVTYSLHTDTCSEILEIEDA